MLAQCSCFSACSNMSDARDIQSKVKANVRVPQCIMRNGLMTVMKLNVAKDYDVGLGDGIRPNSSSGSFSSSLSSMNAFTSVASNAPNAAVPCWNTVLSRNGPHSIVSPALIFCPSLFSRFGTSKNQVRETILKVRKQSVPLLRNRRISS